MYDAAPGPLDGALGLLVVLGIAGAALGVILLMRLSGRVKALLALGLVLHLAGSQLYFYVSRWIYSVGDFMIYYDTGLGWGDAWMHGTTAAFHSPYLAEWCCTGFTVRLTGLLLLVLGPTINGAFFLFGLIGFVGIAAFATAFARAFPQVPLDRYLRWVVLFPSLWYWPAALGKDALVLGGTGIAVLGFAGRRGHVGWFALIAGSALVVAVRPQVAAVLGTSMILAYWTAGDSPWTVSRVFQGIVLAGGALALLIVASRYLGVQLSSPEAVETYLSSRSTASGYGGSAVEGGLFQGLVNVLFRPFPWDVHGVASAIAAAEVMTLWCLAVWKRHAIRDFFVAHRKTRLLWFAVIFAAMYVVLAGLALGNLGLIARQRVLIFPFLFMFLAGAPVEQTADDDVTSMDWQHARIAGRWHAAPSY